jgi:hypothetical protein
MDYKSLMGYNKKSKSKKTIKKNKPTLTENLMKEFGDIEMGKVYTDKDRPPFKTEQKINETIPAFARQWKNMEKAEKIYQKAVMDLSKAVSKVNREHGKTISGLWSYVGSPMKKFKEILSKEVLDKLQ